MVCGHLHGRFTGTGYAFEFVRVACAWREREMAADLRLYCAENIGCAAAFVFTIPSRFPPRLGRRGGSDLGMQCDRLLVQADHRVCSIVRPFVGFQHVLHLGDVLFIEFGHGRGRDAGRPAPPAQIPTGGTTA